MEDEPVITTSFVLDVMSAFLMSNNPVPSATIPLSTFDIVMSAMKYAASLCPPIFRPVGPFEMVVSLISVLTSLFR